MHERAWRTLVVLVARRLSNHNVRILHDEVVSGAHVEFQRLRCSLYAHEPIRRLIILLATEPVAGKKRMVKQEGSQLRTASFVEPCATS